MTPNVGLIGLCGAEWRKIRGRGLVWAVLIFGGLHGLLAVALLKGLQILNDKQLPEPVDLYSWLEPVATALGFAAFPVNGFVLLLLASIVWAEDHSLGTLAMIFVRPVQRWKVFVSKVLVIVAVTALSLLCAVLVAALLGMVLFGFSGELAQAPPIPFYSWMGAFEGTGARLGRIALGVLYAVVVLAPPLCVAAFVANVSRSPVLTLFGTIIILLVDFFVWAGGSAWAGLKLSGGETAGKVVEWTIWGSRRFFEAYTLPEAAADASWQPLLATVGYCGLFLGLGLLLMSRRDIT